MPDLRDASEASVSISDESSDAASSSDADQLDADQLHQPFVQQCLEAKELYLESSVPRIQPPSALEFYREYVARNRPVIIQNGIDDWPALRKWPLKSYLRTKLSSATVTIDRVPVDERTGLGLGDSVVRGSYFVTPSEEQMRFGDFLDVLEGKRHTDGVLYCQHQNSSLTSEFTPLVADVSELAFASEAFGSEPDAINLWIGGDRSVSTLHHDPYENMYAVVAGAKHFLLYPPTDFYFLDKREYPKARWHYQPPTPADAATAAESTAAASSASSSSSSSSSTTAAVPGRGGTFSLIPDPDGARTSWFDLEPQNCEGDTDPTDVDVASLPPLSLSPSATTAALPAGGPSPAYATHPRVDPALRRRYASPVWVELRAGEVLYLPALWFHRVAQKGDEQGKTIAVNFWYDMDYGSRYNAFRFQEAVAKEKRDALAQMHADSEAQPQPSESDREEEEDEEEEQEEHAEAASNAASSAGAAPPPQPPVLLVALCGLPAAGKSLLAQDVTKDRPESWVKNGLPAGVEMHHLSFDGVYARVRAHLLSREGRSAGREERALFDPQVWKLSRAVALQWAEAIVERVRSAAAAQGQSSHAAHILLLDDNFHLRSMRRRVHQLARKHSTSFMQVHVSLEVDRAVRRNDGRNRVRAGGRPPLEEAMVSQEDVAALDAIVAQLPLHDAHSEAAQSPGGDEAAEEDDAVSEATIRNMAAAFQAPPSLKRPSGGAAVTAAAGSRSCFPASVPHSEYSWERLSISVGPGRFEHLDEVERAMAEALRLPLSPLADPAAEAQRVADARAENEANMLHQLDLATRRVLNAQLAACPGDRKAHCASRWNALRRQLLLDARNPGTAAFALCAALQDAASASAQDAVSSSSASAAASSGEDMPAVTLLVAHFKELLQD